MEPVVDLPPAVHPGHVIPHRRRRAVQRHRHMARRAQVQRRLPRRLLEASHHRVLAIHHHPPFPRGEAEQQPVPGVQGGVALRRGHANDELHGASRKRLPWSRSRAAARRSAPPTTRSSPSTCRRCCCSRSTASEGSPGTRTTARALSSGEVKATFLRVSHAKLLAKYCNELMTTGPVYHVGGLGFASLASTPLQNLRLINLALGSRVN